MCVKGCTPGLEDSLCGCGACKKASSLTQYILLKARKTNGCRGCFFDTYGKCDATDIDMECNYGGHIYYLKPHKYRALCNFTQPDTPVYIKRWGWKALKFIKVLVCVPYGNDMLPATITRINDTKVYVSWDNGRDCTIDSRHLNIDQINQLATN